MRICKKVKEFGKKVILLGLVAVLSGCPSPSLEKMKDLTGDKIPDAIFSTYGPGHGTYLYIGQEDGRFVRAKQYTHEGVKFFKTDDGVAYFFDGEFYKPSPQQE